MTPWPLLRSIASVPGRWLVRTLFCAVVAGGVSPPVWADPAAACERASGQRPLTVVELYTSEGCSSCPPADRWLSTLTVADGVLALAFHVSYWNQLGWLDRFATPATTARQHQIKAALRAPYVYTPQVILNGEDFRDWRGRSARDLPALPAPAAPALRLRREGEMVSAHVAASGAHRMLAGYWAVLRDGLRSSVTAGENAGATLRHDHVVSHYQPVAPWPAGQARSLQLHWPRQNAEQVVFVVTDRRGLRPVQALALACP